MGAPKPTLGFRSRTEAVKALRTNGLSTDAIAQKIGISPGTVSALERSAERHRPSQAAAVPYKNTVTISYDLRERLRPHARRRDMTVEALALDVLETAVFSNLVDAILDDEREM